MIRHGIGRVAVIVGVFALGSAAPSAARPAAVSVSVPGAKAVERVVASAEDMARNFAAYPRKWNLRRPDPIIGHYRLA